MMELAIICKYIGFAALAILVIGAIGAALTLVFNVSTGRDPITGKRHD